MPVRAWGFEDFRDILDLRMWISEILLPQGSLVLRWIAGPTGRRLLGIFSTIDSLERLGVFREVCRDLQN